MFILWSNMYFLQGIDMMERHPDLIYVKEEIYDDHPIGQHMNFTDNRKGKFGLKNTAKAKQITLILIVCVLSL